MIPFILSWSTKLNDSLLCGISDQEICGKRAIVETVFVLRIHTYTCILLSTNRVSTMARFPQISWSEMLTAYLENQADL